MQQTRIIVRFGWAGTIAPTAGSVWGATEMAVRMTTAVSFERATDIRGDIVGRTAEID